MKNILVVNVNWLGDVIFSSPIFKALREEYPNSKICCMAVPRVKAILESISEIDEIIIYDEKGKHKNIFWKLKLIWELYSKKFDIAFLLHRSLTRALLVFLARIPQRVGYPTKGRGIFLTRRVEPQTDSLHRSDYYVDVIRSFGVTVHDPSTYLTVWNKDEKRVEHLFGEFGIQDKDFLVVVNPGGNWNLKRWPSHNFSLLIDRLLSDCNAKVIITGSQKDIPLAKKIISPLKNKTVNLAGKLTVKELIALLSKVSLVISADSGPIHLASSVGTEVVGIFGPTQVEMTGPRGRGKFWDLREDVGCNRRACYHLSCKDNICMQAITVEDVIEKIKEGLLD